jgi:hypothetical protein
MYTLLIVALLANGQIVAADREMFIYPSEQACAGAKERNDATLAIQAAPLGTKILISKCVPLRENDAAYCRQWPADCR